MTPKAFAQKHPTLYHLTFTTNLPSIRTHGLLSVAALADTLAFTEEERQASLNQRRLCIQQIGTAAIRDQHTAPESKMKTCLVKITIPDWLALLNSKTFFFLAPDKAARLQSAYADYDNTLLAVDTATLLSTHAPAASVCRINSGSFLWKPVPRGRDSFIPLAQYEPKRKSDVPAELTVDTPIPNLMDFSKIIHSGM